jgi:hypothetical protein
VEVVVDYAPRPYFRPYHERAQRFACIVAHRRAGKTTACIHDTQRAALKCTLPRPRLAYIAPLLKQAKAVAWDILKAAATPLLKHGAQINESELRVDYPNQGQVRLYGADNPDALRGIYLDGVVIDEPAQTRPELFREVLTPALADRQGWATFIGTPKGRDAFYETWLKAVERPQDWFEARLPVSLTKIIPEAELAQQREIQSPSQYAREWECSFDEPDVAQFIDTQIVLAARERPAEPGIKLLGVDIARQGDDRTVAVFRDGDRIVNGDIIVWRNPDLMQTAARVADLINQHKPRATLVDAPGMGWGVIDRLRQMGFQVIAVNGGEKSGNDVQFVNLRAEMWARMREWLRERGSIPNRNDLIADLTAPLYSFDSSNRLKLERKEDMKARSVPSPDVADALALTFARTFPHADVAASSLQVQWAEPVADPFAEF